jgi:hypothetical protein
MMALRTSSFLAVLALVACGSTGGATSGAAGDTVSGSTATTGAGTGGAGTGGAGGAGAGGAGPCAAPAAGTLSFSGVHSTTYDNTMEQVSSSFGDPNLSTLAAYNDLDMLVIAGKNAGWDVEIDLHLEPNAAPPLTITPSSVPNYVGGATFSRGAGLANTFSNDNTFVVKVQEVGCRIKGTFSGAAASVDGLEILTVGQGAFDVPVTAKP